jgi:hypothetical protein
MAQASICVGLDLTMTNTTQAEACPAHFCVQPIAAMEVRAVNGSAAKNAQTFDFGSIRLF